MKASANNAGELIPTRKSLLGRLKDWNDQEGWRQFFETYWRLIYRTAIKAGLNAAEAQDVVQDTVLSVCKSMPNFEYDGEQGSFKKWLLKLTQWRITDQFRKRQREIEDHQRTASASTSTAPIERIEDPGGLALEALWDQEWDSNLLDVAIARVKGKVDLKAYQAFDLYVFKKWTVSRVARALEMNPGRVYLAKHRISKLIRKEIEHLRTTLI